ncbi:pyridoxal phosphate-dependent aminotransferase [Aquamicrobium segne]|uniref:histidinol-phosphate transaminase n=1 Tax=Aquamicrobium segne TaxID=469547 RepID=A0ABW0GUT6_9HYPH
MLIYPPFTPVIAALPVTVPFVGPEAQERKSGAKFRARMGANENGFGPSPRVIEQMVKAAPDMWMYGDPDNHDLRTAIARHHGVSIKNIVIGEGIDGLLGLLTHMYVEPGATVVTSLGAYPTFNFHVAGAGGRLVSVPYENNHENLEGLLEAVRREAPQIVYLANPDNPMGSWWEAQDINRFIEALPQTTMFILDEAYCDLGPATILPAMDIARPNLIRMRTFSKAYGLAGIRCGYAIGEESVIAAFEKVRNHYGVNRMAQIAAQTALEDQDYLDMVVRKVKAGRDRIAAIAAENGLQPQPSATNFVTVDCGKDGAFALNLLNALLARGLFIRKPMAPGLDHCIRISVGLEHEIDALAEEMPGALEVARAL